ncbi:hypothetical protein Hanom_Chr00s000006g01613261 [Helianthus anomalus]
MMSKKDMGLHTSFLDQEVVDAFCRKFVNYIVYPPFAPDLDHLITDCPASYVGFYKNISTSPVFAFLYLGYCWNLFLGDYGLDIRQLDPLSAIKVIHFKVMCHILGGSITIPLF